MLEGKFGVICVLAILGFFVYSIGTLDNRPDAVKWVTDARNQCTLRNEIQLANHQVHVHGDQYQLKILSMYDCKGGQTAALIREVKDVQ